MSDITITRVPLPTPPPYPGYPVPRGIGAPTAVGLEGLTAVADIAWVAVIGLVLLLLLALAIYVYQGVNRDHLS